MKKFLMVLITIIFISCAFFNPAFGSLQDGLVAYYPFNGNANDESGNGYHGSNHNATLTEDRHGNPDSAYLFEGDSAQDYIRSSPDLPIGNEPRSISVWFNTSDQVSAASGWNHNTIVSWGSCSTNKLNSLSVASQKLHFGGFNNDFQIVDPFVADGQWHHAVFTYDGAAKAILYLDNQYIKEVELATPLNTSDSDLYIGKRVQQENQYMNGMIDDIRIYNRALTASEVKELYAVNEAYDSTLRISAAGTAEYTRIRDAIDSTGFEVTNIQITEGVYWEDIVISSSKRINIQGGFDSTFSGAHSQTLINGVMTIEKGAQVSLKNITVREKKEGYEIYKVNDPISTIYGTKVEIPEESVQGLSYVSIKEEENPQPPAEGTRKYVGPTVDITIAFKDGSRDSTINNAIITLPYFPNKLPSGTSPGSVFILHGKTGGQPERISFDRIIEINEAEHTVSFRASEFSSYTVSADETISIGNSTFSGDDSFYYNLALDFISCINDTEENADYFNQLFEKKIRLDEDVVPLILPKASDLYILKLNKDTIEAATGVKIEDFAKYGSNLGKAMHSSDRGDTELKLITSSFLAMNVLEGATELLPPVWKEFSKVLLIYGKILVGDLIPMLKSFVEGIAFSIIQDRLNLSECGKVDVVEPQKIPNMKSDLRFFNKSVKGAKDVSDGTTAYYNIFKNEGLKPGADPLPSILQEFENAPYILLMYLEDLEEFDKEKCLSTLWNDHWNVENIKVKFVSGDLVPLAKGYKNKLLPTGSLPVLPMVPFNTKPDYINIQIDLFAELRHKPMHHYDSCPVLSLDICDSTDVYEENFDDGKADFWKEDETDSWSVSSGQYRAYKANPDINLEDVTAYYSGTEFGDGTYEVDFPSTSVGPMAQYLGIKSSPDYDYANGIFKGSGIFFGIDKDSRSYFIFLVYDGVYHEKKDWTKSNYINETGNNRMKIVSNGSNYYFYINGSSIYSFQDSSFSKGYFRLFGCTKSSMKSTHFFDNVKFSSKLDSNELEMISDEQRILNEISAQAGKHGFDDS
jgi:hypothetical protein